MTGTALLIAPIILLAAGLGLWIYAERGRLLRPSTWKVLRAGGLRGLFNLKSLHGYIYSRWTNQYLNILFNKIVPRLGERGKKWWRDRYHSKILTQELAEAVILLDHDIARRDLEQIIPYPMARDLVLKGPPDTDGGPGPLESGAQTRTSALRLVQRRLLEPLLCPLQLLQVLLRRHRGDAEIRRWNDGLLGPCVPGQRGAVHVLRPLRGGLSIWRPLNGWDFKSQLGEVHGVRGVHGAMSDRCDCPGPR